MKDENKIRFLNKYQPAGWYSRERKNLCDRIIKWIPTYIASSKLLNISLSDITFLSGGVASVICRIDLKEKKYIIKVVTSKHSRKGVVLFLQRWREIGVRVPKVFDTGIIFDCPYILMEYIDALPISRAYTSQDLTAKNIFFTLGEILSAMHRVRAQGWGNVLRENGEFNTALQWYVSPEIQEQMETALQGGFLKKQEQKFIEDFILYADKKQIITYCHNDFSPSNILLTKPFTVIDPTPVIHHPLFDAARTIVLLANFDVDMILASKQFIDGYIGDHKMPRELYGAILLQACFKFCYWRKIGKISSIERIGEFLKENPYRYEL